MTIPKPVKTIGLLALAYGFYKWLASPKKDVIETVATEVADIPKTVKKKVKKAAKKVKEAVTDAEIIVANNLKGKEAEAVKNGEVPKKKRKSRFVKGSPEAKAYMASLRQKQKKKK